MSIFSLFLSVRKSIQKRTENILKMLIITRLLHIKWLRFNRTLKDLVKDSFLQGHTSSVGSQLQRLPLQINLVLHFKNISSKG